MTVGVFVLQSSAQIDLPLTRKSQESLSSGIHVTVASDDTVFMSVTPETEARSGSTPRRPHPSVTSSLMGSSELRGSLRFPSLPGNLDLTSGLAASHKHLSDPVLPVTSQLECRCGCQSRTCAASLDVSKGAE